MSRIRLNQEMRNKTGTRMRVHIEAEDTVEKQDYDNKKADQIEINDNAWELAKKIVRRQYTQVILSKQNISKTSLRMLTLFNQIVVFIFIILANKKKETMTIML